MFDAPSHGNFLRRKNPTTPIGGLKLDEPKSKGSVDKHRLEKRRINVINTWPASVRIGTSYGSWATSGIRDD